MNRRAFAWAIAVVASVSTTGARAADIRLAENSRWSFSWNARSQLSMSVPLTNASATNSGPITIRLWATNDPRSSAQVSSGFVLLEEVLSDGLAGLESIEVNTDFADLVEEPDAGQYNIALTVDEDAFDTGGTITSFSSDTRLDFPLPEVPSEAEIRRRVASQIPCGAFFVQFSLATFLGLCAIKRHCQVTRRGR